MKNKQTHIRIGLSLLIALFLSSTAMTETNIWVTGPSHKVLRNEKPPLSPPLVYTPKTKTINLFAARNEFVSFQIVFPGPRSNVNVAPFTLTGPSGSKLKHVEMFREHFLKHESISQIDGKNKVPDCLEMDKKRKAIGASWEYPVQMVPLKATKYGAPFDVHKGENEVVWVDIFVPENTPAGIFKGSIQADNTTLNVQLKVWDFTLPSVSHFPCWGYVGPEDIAYSFRKTPSDIGSMMPTFDAYFQMAHNHRFTLMETIEYGWAYMTNKDRKFEDYYTGKAFKGPFGEGYGFELLPLGHIIQQDILNAIEKNKWQNRAFAYLMDEPGSKGQYEAVISRGLAVKKASKGKIKRFVTEQYTPSKSDWPSLDPAVDIFCSAGTPPKGIAEVEKNGNVVWTYNAGWVGSMLTDAPGTAPRTQAWSGYLTGSRAWFFWDAVYVIDKHNRWKKQRRVIRKNPAKYLTDVYNVALNFDEATKPGKGGKLYPASWSLRHNGDGLLFYPGYDVGIAGPIACYRLKGLRRGSQDFEYLYLLEKAGQKDLAMKEAQQLIGKNVANIESRDGQRGRVRLKYERDPNKWDEARVRLGTALDKIGEKKLRSIIKPYNQYPNPVGLKNLYGGKRY